MKLNPYRLVWAAALLVAAAAFAGAAAQARTDLTAAASIVLGSRSYAPNGAGFGTGRPHTIFNGGDPSGRITHVRWRSWGRRIARGSGLGAGFRPGGGYYSRPVKTRIRAYRRGRCSANGRRAYTRMRVQQQKRPGGPFGHWFGWGGGNGNICR